MKQEREEMGIRELFQRLKQEDERRAPSFAHSWTAALSRRQRGYQPWPTWRLAAVALVLLSLGAAWLVFYQRGHGRAAKQMLPIETVTVTRPATIAPPPVIAPLPPAIRPSMAVRRRRPPSRSQPDVALLSQWRSPTEFLLHTPGDQLLKTVPRLGGSLIEIKALAPEQKNELEEQ